MGTSKKIKSKPKPISKKGIEKGYEKQMNLLMEQVYGILEHQDKSWSPNDEELYSLLERVIFLKARENTFRDFFDNMESVIEAASQLDFSKRAPISEVSIDKRNLFNYAVMCLNILVEKMGNSVVSMKAVNTMLALQPGTMVIVTDSKGVIRFMNDTGEKLLGLKRNEFLSKSISLLLHGYQELYKEIGNTAITNRAVYLISPDKKGNRIPVYLTVPAPYTDHTEIEEVVYLLSLETGSHDLEERQFNLAHTFRNTITPLNTIIDASHLLNEKIADTNCKRLIHRIQSNARKLKSDITATFTKIKTGSFGSSERTAINLAHFVSDIVKSSKFNSDFEDVKFDVNIDYDNELYADPTLVYSLFKSVLSLVVSQSYVKQPFIQISVWDLNKSEVLIRIHDNGIGIQAKDKEKLTDDSLTLNDEKDAELYELKNTVKRLKGSLDIYSKHGRGCTFTFKIPCANKT